MANTELVEKLDELAELLKDNFCLSSVVILVTESPSPEDSCSAFGMSASRRGNAYEQIGMLDTLKVIIQDELYD